MNEQALRQVMRESVDDAALGPSTVDLDRIMRDGDRSIAVRRIAGIGAVVAATAAVVIAVPAVLGGGDPDGPRPGVTGTAPTTAPTTASPAPSDPVGDAIRTIEAAIPGVSMVHGDGRMEDPYTRGNMSPWPIATGSPVPGTRAYDTSRTLSLTGTLAAGRRRLASVTLLVRPTGAIETLGGSDPCRLEPGRSPGRQGAPAPDDVCDRLPQQNGSVVWIWRKGHSAYRQWTTEDTREWQVSVVRPDRVHVDLTLSNLRMVDEPDRDGVGTPNFEYDTPKFEVTDAALVAVVTSRAVRPFD